MPIKFKIDILAALKEKGYNTNRLRKEEKLSESVIQAIRDCQRKGDSLSITISNIAKICELLECQPGDILYLETNSNADPDSSTTE